MYDNLRDKKIDEALRNIYDSSSSSNTLDNTKLLKQETIEQHWLELNIAEPPYVISGRAIISKISKDILKQGE